MNNNQIYITTVTIPLREYEELRRIKNADGVYLHGIQYMIYGLEQVEKTLRHATLAADEIISNNKTEIYNLKQKISTLENKKSFWKRLFK